MGEKISQQSTKRKTAVDKVFDALMDKFANYEYMPGDRLPAENDLAEQYGVSRITIRMALNMFSTMGLIETRNGGGSYVKKFHFSDITDSASAIMANQVKNEDVNQFRHIIETASLNNLRGKKVTTADVKYLKNCCERMDNASKKGQRNEIAKADYDFHKHICKMSGNTMFIYSYDMIGSLMLVYFDKHYKTSSEINVRYYLENALTLHRRIIECITSGDIDTAIEINESMTINDEAQIIEAGF